MLANQYEILSILHKEDKTKSQHYSMLQQIFQQGFAGVYDIAEHDMGKELSEPETNFVMNVLQMYIKIYRSTEENGEDASELQGEPIYFNGFDMHKTNEFEYIKFTELAMKEFLNYNIIEKMMEENKFRLYHGDIGPSVSQLSMMTVRAQFIDKRLEQENRSYYTNAEILDIIHTR